MTPESAPDIPMTRIPFTARDEASIKALAGWMRTAAIISLAGGALRIVLAFTPRRDVGQLVGGVITILLGLWTYKAGTAFAQVASTDTADQRFLMDGFTLLRRVFLMQAILIFVGLALVIVAIAVGVLFFLAARPQ